MSTAHDIISAIIAFLLTAGLIYGSWRRWVTRPDAGAGRDCAPHQPKHALSRQERIPSRDDLACWREDWTDAELAAMRAAVVAPAPSPQRRPR